MCRMWERIRSGVRWSQNWNANLACRAMNLRNVKAIDISMDPFYAGNVTLFQFWYRASTRAKKTNPRLKLNPEIRNDGKPPFFVAHLKDDRKLIFKTEGMHLADIVMRFNRHLGNSELGKSGKIRYKR